MKIVDQGFVFKGTTGTRTTSCCFPAVACLPNGELLVTFRVGTSKEAADGNVWLTRSADAGKTWSKPIEPFVSTWEGVPGELRFAAISVLSDGRLLAAMYWIDRKDPHLPIFNPKTEGLAPVQPLLSESKDLGKTWSKPWVLSDSPYGTTRGLTGPVLDFGDGLLAAQYEVNKNYNDPAPWRHATVLQFSTDGGKTFPRHLETSQDPTLRMFYYDGQYTLLPSPGVEGGGAFRGQPSAIAAFWTYDHEKQADTTIHLIRSIDRGQTWSKPWDTKITGQITQPIYLPNGRLLLVWVDRFGTRSIRAAISTDHGRTFGPQLEIYKHAQEDPGKTSKAGDYLQDMELWTFGRAHASLDSRGNVWVVYYGGDRTVTHIRWARLEVPGA